jgi:hypothetical protein
MKMQAKRKKNGLLKPAFGEIFVCSNKELAPYGTVFVAPAENYESENLGTLFGILKISDPSPDSSYIVNLLTSVMKKEYFSRSDRPSEESFEASLRKANLALAEMARHGSTSWAGKIDFAGGSIGKNTLHFSNLGKTSVFLVRSGQIANISRDLDSEKTAEPHPMKTFTDISSGRLEKGDKIIFATSDLLDIFSPDELRHNATRYSKDEFSGLLEASLHANAEMAGVIVIDLVDQVEIGKKGMAITPYSQGTAEPEKSEQKEDFDPFKAESPQPQTSGPIMSEIVAPPKKEYREHLFVQEESGDETGRTPVREKTVVFLKNKFQAIKFFLGNSAGKIVSTYHTIKIKEKMFLLFRGKVRPGHFVEKIRENSRYFSRHMSGLEPRRKKVYLGILIFVILLFVVGIFIHRNNSQETAPEPESQPSSQTEPAVPSAIEDTNVKTVSNLENFVSLSQNAIAAVLLNDSLFAIAENSKKIIKIDLNSKNVEDIPSSAGTGNFKLMTPMPHLNTIFILTEDKKILSFTPVNKNFQENGIELPGSLNATDIKTYLTYLYFLDPSANQIYRYPRAEGGFGEKQDWLRSGSDVKNAVDFAINDDLYTVSPNEIVPYLQGKKDAGVNFEKTSLPLAIDKIYSEPDMEFVYLLDNKNHRIVQYSKDGKLITQYWNESISGISNLAVDEKNKVVYLIKESSIDKFYME